MTPHTPHPKIARPIWPGIAANIIVAVTMVVIAIRICGGSVAALGDIYLVNLQATVWLFVIGFAIGAVLNPASVSPALPISPAFGRWVNVVARTEQISQGIWKTAFSVGAGLLIRGPASILATSLVLAWNGNDTAGALVRCTAVLPGALCALARRFLVDPVVAEMPSWLRGTQIGGQTQANSRAQELTARALMELSGTRQNQMFNIVPVRSQVKRRVLYLPWGGVELPVQYMPPHFLVMGTPQSGKTLVIRMLLKNALCHGLPGRCLIYDGKREYYPMLIGMGIPPEQIYILNPADARCAAWDLAGDIANRDDARNIVELLIPDDSNRHDNPFFPQAVRSLVTEVMMILQSISPGTWKLNDVINALRTPAILRYVLENTREGREVRDRYFTEAKEAVGGIISTIDARFISLFETVAVIWVRATRTIRLKDWIHDNSAILLGYDSNRSAVDRINRAIFQRAAQLTTALPENADLTIGKTWVVLDELRFAGKMPMLPELISFGRTKGVRVVLAPQDIDGLCEVYGEHVANEMLSLCGNVGVLRISSPKTREWAAKFFGEYEAWERDYGGSTTDGSSRSSGPGGQSRGSSSSITRSWNRKIVKRDSVLSSEFFNLPMTNRINGLHGFFATPEMGAWYSTMTPQFIDDRLPHNDEDAQPFEPRPETAIAPLRWQPEEEALYTPAAVKKTKSAEPESEPPDVDPYAPTADADTPPDDIDDTPAPPAAVDPEPKKGKEPKRRGSLPKW